MFLCGLAVPSSHVLSFFIKRVGVQDVNKEDMRGLCTYVSPSHRYQLYEKGPASGIAYDLQTLQHNVETYFVLSARQLTPIPLPLLTHHSIVLSILCIP